MKWTIAFDGKNLGRVTTQAPTLYKFYSSIGLETITSQSPIPTVGKKSADYADFTGTPVYRPLVAVSQPNFSDPDQWKLAQFSPEWIVVARQQFRAKFPKVSNCRNAEDNHPQTWNYRDEDIKLIKAYASNKGWSLLELSLAGYTCDSPEDGTAFIGQWYVVNPSGEPSFLGSDMRLVDTGDYDNSGSSELFFSIDGYNRGGYRLFYRDFTRSAEFSFSYH